MTNLAHEHLQFEQRLRTEFADVARQQMIHEALQARPGAGARVQSVANALRAAGRIRIEVRLVRREAQSGAA